MARDLAGRADHGPGLDLDESPDPGVVADPAAVEVRERPDRHVLAELDVDDQAMRGFVGGPIGQVPQDATEVTKMRRNRGKDPVNGPHTASGGWATMTLPARQEGRSCSNASPNGPDRSSS